MPELTETADVEATEAEPDTIETADVEATETEPDAIEDQMTPIEPDTVEDEVTPEVPDAEVVIPDPDVAEPAATEPAATEPAAAEAVETESEAEVEAAAIASPYDLPGDWYVIHSYSGYENKVKANLETRIQSMHMEDRIFEVHIPMEDVVEFKAGKKVTVPRKVFPGYILVRMILDDDSWYAVRNTPGVTGFVAGNAQKPTPLSRREVERFLGVQEEEEKTKPRFKPEWEVGEQVRVVTGPFADFNGVIEDMNVDQQKVTVLVNIFGRDTPVELGFEDIQKN
jgi:transcriptional antiterminator NusG